MSHLRSVITVTFAEGATQQQRQAAVDLVNGCVVGGYGYSRRFEGDYYVRIPNATPSTLAEAIMRLDSLPQVDDAKYTLAGFGLD